MMNTTQIAVRVPNDVLDQVKALAIADERKTAAMVILLIKAGIVHRATLMQPSAGGVDE